MSDKSSIEWLRGGATWNAIRARNLKTGKVGWFCEHASAGCANCYAERMNLRVRLEKDGSMVGIGNGLAYKPIHLKDVEIFLDEKILDAPLRWRAPRLVFPCSMTDLFGRWVTDEMLDRIFSVMAQAQKHQFLCLTKRADRMRDYLLRWRPDGDGWVTRDGAKAIRNEAVGPIFADNNWPPRNVWLGVSVEDQQRADERIPLLLQTPATVRWVSAEPLLGPVTLNPWLLSEHGRRHIGAQPGLSWVVVGGESGPGARPFDVEWAWTVVKQCRAAKVPVFVKQLGAVPLVPACRQTHFDYRFGNGFEEHDSKRWRMKLSDKKGGDVAEWAEHLRVREFPGGAR